LTSLRDNILTTDLGGRTQQQQLAATRELFDQATGAARAAGTTSDEAQRLAELAPLLIEQTRAAFGSSWQTDEQTRQITAIVNELTGGLNREDRQLRFQDRSLALQEKGFEHHLPAAVRNTEATAQNTAAANRRLEKMEETLDRLNEQILLLRRSA
jgi:hypothetical protein